MTNTATTPCPTCGGGIDEAIQWRDWQTVAMIQDCEWCVDGWIGSAECSSCDGPTT